MMCKYSGGLILDAVAVDRVRRVGGDGCVVNWGADMEQQPSKDDRRDIARRLFKALCARFPDRYVILIESRDDASQASAPRVAS